MVLNHMPYPIRYTREARLASGFTLIELMVALLLLSVAALALSTTLASTRRALTLSAKWMRAAQLAGEGIEQLRAGQVPDAGPTADGFSRAAAVAPWNGHAAVQRLEVIISWDDGGVHTFQLSTLARR